MPTVSRRVIWTLYFIAFIDIAQLSFVWPILPQIVQSYGYGATEIGVLGTIAATAKALAAPWLGALSDKYGRKPVLVTAMVGSMIDSFTLGMSQSYTMVLIARLAGGICGGTTGIVMAYLSEVTDQKERPGYITYAMAAIFGGTTFGPAAAGIINSYFGWRFACFCASATCASNLVFMLLFLPPSPRRDTDGPTVSSMSSDEVTRRCSCCHAMRDKFSLPCGAWWLGFANLFATLGFTAFEAIGVLYIQDEFYKNAPTKEADASLFYSKVLSGIGITGLVTNIFLYHRISKAIGLKGSIAVGGFVKAVGFAGLAFPRFGKWGFLAASQVLVLGDQIQRTSVQTMVTHVVDPSNFGKAFGVMSLFSSSARALGPSIYAPIYEEIDHTIPWYLNIATSLLGVLCAVLPPGAKKKAVGDIEPAPEAALNDDAEFPEAALFARQVSDSVQASPAFLGGDAPAAIMRYLKRDRPSSLDTLTFAGRGTSFDSQPDPNWNRAVTLQ